MFELESHSKSIRQTIVNLVYQAKTSHVGSCLSVTDILVALYFDVMNIDPKDPKSSNRDRMILSKGHSIAALYGTLAQRGFFPKKVLHEYGKDGAKLASHGVRDALPGIEVSTGSGGHGLPIGVGFALALQRLNNDAKVYVVSGDGEMAEGSVWEAILFAGFHKLSNLKLVIDHNNLQDGQDGLHTNEILDPNPFKEKLHSFHWNVDMVDGHSFEQLVPALRKKTKGPHVIVAKTIKGKGVSFMEDLPEWHGKCPNEKEYKAAMQELK